MGFDKFGFDEEGYNREGFNKWGFDREGYNKEGYDIHGINRAGFNKLTGRDKDGYDKDGYDEKGFDRNGRDKDGFNSDGYDSEGYNRDGYDINGFNRLGRDRQGFDAKGFDVNGYNREGYDKDGYNKLGYDKNGFDKQGYNAEGFNIEGYDRFGRDKYGYDKNGYDAWGIDRLGYDKEGYTIFGYDSEGYDFDGYDQAGFNANGIHRNGFFKTDFDELGYHVMMGINLEGYDRDGFNINGIDKEGYDRNGYDINGFDRAGFDKEGYNRAGFDKMGYGRDGFNRAGFDKEGYDRIGFNSKGYDRAGYDREGYNSEGYDRAGLDRMGKPKIEKKSIQYNKGLSPSDLKVGRKVYHQTLGEGEILRVFDDTVVVEFSEEYTVSRDTAFKIFSLVDLKRLEEQENSYDFTEDVTERNYFKETLDYVRNSGLANEKSISLKRASKDRVITTTVNGFIVEKIVTNDSPAWTSFKSTPYADNPYLSEPYFAHISCKANDKIYIGKKKIGTRVVDWADEKASFYYQYQIYIGNRDVGLELVRDIDINTGVYTGFRDKYNTKSKEKDYVEDEGLIKIIKANQQSKQIHDIIRSIQNNQYNIITHDAMKDSLVLGCAGSGKTMILLHKIRYISYNMPDFNLEDIIIISPTDILERESKELSKILGISSVQQFTAARFYLSCLETIIENNNIFLKDNITINHMMANTDCYDYKKLVAKYNYIDDICDNDEQRVQYVINERGALHRERELVESRFKDSDVLPEIESLFSNACKELRLYSPNAIIHHIQECKKVSEKKDRLILEKRIIEILLDYKCFGNKENRSSKRTMTGVENEFLYYTKQVIVKIDFDELETRIILKQEPNRKFILQNISICMGNALEENLIRLVQKEWDGISESELKKHKTLVEKSLVEISKRDFAIKCLSYAVENGYFNGKTEKCREDFYQKSQIISMMKLAEWEKSEFDIIGDLYILQQQKGRIERLDQFGEGNVESYIFEVVLNCLGTSHGTEKQEEIVLSAGELFAILLYLQKRYKYVDNTKKMFFIDEFQDFSKAEHELIRGLYPNSIFNYYGDYNQCINDVGLSTNEAVNEAISVKDKFKISENYRNPKQVTKYVKKRFPTIEMKEIGLDGTVQEQKKIKLEVLKKGDRAAIIVSNSCEAQVLYDHLLERYPHIHINNFIDSGYLARDAYNILPVIFAKGLEFEVVVLVEDELSDNQIYVGCTRALRDLRIVKTKRSG